MITDDWTGQFGNDEYWGVAAQIMNSLFEQELIIIGMVEIKKGHCAEETKLAIEQVVNKYKFDKKKVTLVFLNNFFNIKGIVCDEGSNLIRLFHQILATTESDIEVVNQGISLYNTEIEIRFRMKLMIWMEIFKILIVLLQKFSLFIKKLTTYAIKIVFQNSKNRTLIE